MTKVKNEPALRVASAIENATRLIANRVAGLGGSYTEALVHLGTGEKQHATDLDELAAMYARVSRGFAPPQGGRIHIIRSVFVDESAEWNAAIDSGLPNTLADYNIRKVGASYPPQKGAELKRRDVILVNFGRYIPDNQPAHAWGKANHLPPASPREIWKLGEHSPELHEELGQPNGLVVGCLEECNFSGNRHVPYGWWDGAKRKANLNWPDNGWNDDCWFAFSRKSRCSPAAFGRPAFFVADSQ